MGPKWVQNGSKMGPKWVQNGSKMGPKCVQNGFKIIQNQSRMFRISPKLAQNEPKNIQQGTQLPSRVCALAPRIGWSEGTLLREADFFWSEFP